MENGSVALENYTLSSEAKAAIASGDLKWINENVGELTQKQLMFIYKRLEREACNPDRHIFLQLRDNIQRRC